MAPGPNRPSLNSAGDAHLPLTVVQHCQVYVPNTTSMSGICTVFSATTPEPSTFPAPPVVPPCPSWLNVLAFRASPVQEHGTFAGNRVQPLAPHVLHNTS
jgi:hypothetical protein